MGEVLAWSLKRVVRCGVLLAAPLMLTVTANASLLDSAPPTGTPALPPGVPSGLPPASQPGATAGALSDGRLAETVKRLEAGKRAPAGIKTVGDMVNVEIVHDSGSGPIKSDVQQLGGTVVGSVPGEVTEALVPFDELDSLEQKPGVAYLRAPLRVDAPVAGNEGAVTSLASSGSVLGEEVAKTNAAAWQAVGYTGAGVKIGIIDSFNLTAWNAAAAVGDVPPTLYGSFCQVNGSACNIWGGVTHGVGVAEVIHEQAPDAQLYLASAATASDLQAVVNYFAGQGVKIVSRSMTAEFDGPGNGTGPIASVIDSAVAQGMTWFNSAGNNGGPWIGGTVGSYWRGSWIDSNADGFIEFVPGHEGMAFGCGGLINGLRWSDWGAAAGRTNYDVYVYDDPGLTTIVATGVANQQTGANPIELPHYSCNTSDPIDFIAIRLINAGSGTAGDVLEYEVNGTGVGYWQNPFSAAGPASDSGSPGALSIGAVDPVNGTTLGAYSSQGPTNDNRLKPELSAAAGMSGFTFGAAPPGFQGTSASTPAAAGAAALVLQAGVATTPSELRNFLITSARVDRGSPGPDNAYGNGELVLPSPPGAGKIAFTSFRDGNGEVYVMNGDGSGQSRRTNNAGLDQQPVLSPDGQRIAFTSDRDGNGEIYVMSVYGTGQTRLTNNSASDTEPYWSPDGTKIAFQSNRDGNYEIYVMNSDGTAQTRLTNNAAGDGPPGWSPDGSKIAFSSSRDGNFEIYTMNADGTAQTRRTNNPAFDAVPTWSPDGTKIAFESDRDGNSEIYTMNADGTAQTNVSTNAGTDRAPAWWSGGQRIAFESNRYGNYDVFVMSADGSVQTRLTNNSADDIGAFLQPPAQAYARPKGATPFRASLVPAYRECLIPNRTHGSPLVFGSCNPPVQESNWLTVGSPDANGAAANSVGSLSLNAIVGDGVPPDDADARVTMSMTDVRNKAGLADYTGNLLLNIRVRLSDKSNASTDSGTVQDFDFGVVFFCVATADPAVGGTCSGTSTLDALYPTIVKEGARAVWQLDRVKVFDGGSDGNVNTPAGNTLFATQGVLVP